MLAVKAVREEVREWAYFPVLPVPIPVAIPGGLSGGPCGGLGSGSCGAETSKRHSGQGNPPRQSVSLHLCDLFGKFIILSVQCLSIDESR